jgi:hypothetical protein
MDDVTKMQTEPGGAPLQVIIGGMQQYKYSVQISRHLASSSIDESLQQRSGR